MFDLWCDKSGDQSFSLPAVNKNEEFIIILISLLVTKEWRTINRLKS